MDKYSAYVQTLGDTLNAVTITDINGHEVPSDETIERMGVEMHGIHDTGGKVMFIGNGGSAGICSHMATDYLKNGRIRSTAFNDSSALTCLGNDLGYDQVFAEQIHFHGNENDILIAISSSGSSANILNGVKAAREKGCRVYTLSGFDENNPLRKTGDINIYLRNTEYGFVEVGHLAVLHAVLDVHMGWHPHS